MCRTYDPNRATVTVNLARLGTRAATPLDRAVLAVLTERARAAGDSIHPDDVAAGATHYAAMGTVEPHTPGCGCIACTDGMTDAELRALVGTA